ncbi:hypothetical protein S40288_04421 [Stachybotrys chartarum IBT 40288]|nr:hypothetical protein S40288_04421 [Stachybotrys chartarum IBT 40288]
MSNDPASSYHADTDADPHEPSADSNDGNNRHPHDHIDASVNSIGQLDQQPSIHLQHSTPTLPSGAFDGGRNNARSALDAVSLEERSPGSRGSPLRISTELRDKLAATAAGLEAFHDGNNSLSPTRIPVSLDRKTSASSLKLLSRTPSLKAALTHNYGSGASSGYPSPVISAMGDMTPLPSPLMTGDSPGPWKRLAAAASPPSQRLRSVGEGSVLVTSSGESVDSAMTNASKRKMYASLEPGVAPSTRNDSSDQHTQVQEHNSQPHAAAQGSQPRHTRNRSVSDYVPDSLSAPRRQVAVSGSHIRIDTTKAQEPQLKRELNLAQSRGLTPTVTQPPTPPPSESSKDSTDGSVKSKLSGYEYFEAQGRHDNKRRRWRSIRLLGTGTFSRVMLATSQMVPDDDASDQAGQTAASNADRQLDRKTLVAVKVCEHGPRGGASEERVEMSLKRELEIMQSIHHPSLVDLKAWSIEPTRAILVLGYCPGGDLFDVATAHRKLLTPPLLRRIFSELVGAVSYLHERRIVHRDIKLENVLVTLTPDELENPSIDWTTYPYSVTSLTDLGLSRRVADDEKLETRCGSEDYAAPEVIMGQPYDGRATDAWSLGVLLYSLLEARLPFDPHPGMSDAHRMRSRTSHRIARIEWRWVQYAGDDTEHDGDEKKFREKGLLGALEITEGLLKRARSRWTMDKVAKHPWVRDAIQVDGGLRFREQEDGEEV